MILFSDTGLYKLTLRKPADTSQAPFVSRDKLQPSKYHDLTRFLYRLAPALLAYLSSAVLFFEIYKTGW